MFSKEKIMEVLANAVHDKASDIFVIAGLDLSVKINGVLYSRSDNPLTPKDTEEIIGMIIKLAGDDKNEKFAQINDADISISVQGAGRFRVSTYRQRSSLAAVIRVVPFGLPDPVALGIPMEVMNLYKYTKGLILVTGPTGSGKSTTLACIIDAINSNRKGHIITLEDPIEFLHYHNQSVVSQREVPTDTPSYFKALKASLHHSPDVILVGEMRDMETISIALTAAETGHLILSTLHTMSAVNTIDRIIDVFPPQQQQQIKIQLAMTLQAVVSQQILPTVDHGTVAAFEVMINNTAIANMIRESKLHQINSVIQSSRDIGMMSIDSSILNLYKQGKITRETALNHCVNQEALSRQIKTHHNG